MQKKGGAKILNNAKMLSVINIHEVEYLNLPKTYKTKVFTYVQTYNDKLGMGQYSAVTKDYVASSVRKIKFLYLLLVILIHRSMTFFTSLIYICKFTC